MKKLSLYHTPLNGTIEVPGDKSISHRAVMFGSLANGVTQIEHFLPGEDCLSTISCFRKMGIDIVQSHENVSVTGAGWNGIQEPKEVLDVGNSGTTARLLLGILAGLPNHSCLIGDESIGRRPMRRVTEPLREMGAKIDGRQDGQYTPISIRGGGLKGMHYQSPIASAQVKSAILLAGLNGIGETTVTEPHQSRDHTERMLLAFGAVVETNENTVSVKGGQSLTATSIYVPGDISSAAFFLVAGAITPESNITLKNVGINPTRTGVIDVLQQMGASISITNHQEKNFEPFADLHISTSNLKGIEISGSLIPRLIDEIPIIALLATQAEGTTIIKDASELKVKETNRIDTVVNELSKLGASIEATEDGMIIHGGATLSGNTVNSYGDHRIGMMLSIASFITEGIVEVENTEAIAVSYPTFFDDIQSLTKR
ncbi:3-phosphoshikimate 1-carboxyvinyltransferase [Bacillus suaedaesalsae]|uniref:3-phosphoshikimate 1-carboxyvinyltransferase n=1 Tax=Bacillus suaedaesalsae TaxID=2810349 RepID=A0ABS2DMW7_9BACI|nr:3-phosphoshikimate 1-carboxyvinyltransferase [Bacillus suaedaesalsae]MBM6619852.1 3-phosphoshikimate 1-carboxyvinyltransferase [Bacillus suaedaesalsae]